MNTGEVWWKYIIKTNYFLNKITDTLLGGKSLALFLPSMVPWHDTMLELIIEHLRSENSNNAFDVIDCPKEEAGQFLLDKYCKKEKRARYRYGIGYAAFLGQSEDIVLNNRYVWVRNISEHKYHEWMDFIAEYNKNVGKTRPAALFILEIADQSISRTVRKGIEKIVFDQTISTYDVYTFAALISAEVNCREMLKPYMAELVANICQDDVELCAMCVKYGENFLRKPLETIHRIVREEERSDQSAFRFDYDEAFIKKCIWESQLKILFPLIEGYRSEFVMKYSNSLKEILPIKNAYGDTVILPQDVELGMLFNLAARGKIVLGSREYQELVLFKDARNHLAHMDIVEMGEVEAILGYRRGRWMKL